MNTELCWLLLPIAGLLSQLGGTWNKAFRRYGIPLAVVITLGIFMGWRAIYILTAVHLWGAYCLPITKFGDNIPDDWRNWLWIPFLCIFMCSSVLWLNWQHYWPSCLVCGVLLSLLMILSNIQETAKYFPWKMVEFFEGVLSVIPICYLITLQ